MKDIKKALIFRFKYKRNRVIGIIKIEEYKVCIIWYCSNFNIIQCKVIYVNNNLNKNVNKCGINIAIFNHRHKLIILFVNFFKVTISYTEYLIYLYIFLLVFFIVLTVDYFYNFDIIHWIFITGCPSFLIKTFYWAYSVKYCNNKIKTPNYAY